MSDLIELTDEEREVALDALRDISLRSPFAAAVGLENAIAAINDVRRGDPVGTVRRHIRGHATAVLTEDGWIYVGHNGDHAASGPLVNHNWHVVYRPGEEP